MIDYSIKWQHCSSKSAGDQKNKEEVLYSSQLSMIFNLSIKSIYLVLDNSTSWTQGYIHLGDGHFWAMYSSNDKLW